MQSIEQIINEVDLFNADLSNITLSKKKRKDFIVYPIKKIIDIDNILIQQANLLKFNLDDIEAMFTNKDSLDRTKKVIKTLEYINNNYKLIKK